MPYASRSGRSSMVERELPKLYTRVRFPSLAPIYLHIIYLPFLLYLIFYIILIQALQTFRNRRNTSPFFVNKKRLRNAIVMYLK